MQTTRPKILTLQHLSAQALSALKLMRHHSASPESQSTIHWDSGQGTAPNLRLAGARACLDLDVESELEEEVEQAQAMAEEQEEENIFQFGGGLSE